MWKGARWCCIGNQGRIDSRFTRIQRVTRQGNSAALIIDRTLMDLLDIDQDTDLKLTVNGKQLLVERLGEKEQSKRVGEISKDLIARNSELYRRLAK